MTLLVFGLCLTSLVLNCCDFLDEFFGEYLVLAESLVLAECLFWPSVCCGRGLGFGCVLRSDYVVMISEPRVTFT